MVKVRQGDLPQNPDARAIVKVLAELTYNRHNDRVFSDFLTLTEIYLRRLPINTLHVVQHGHWPTDDGETMIAWTDADGRHNYLGDMSDSAIDTELAQDTVTFPLAQ